MMAIPCMYAYVRVYMHAFLLFVSIVITTATEGLFHYSLLVFVSRSSFISAGREKKVVEWYAIYTVFVEKVVDLPCANNPR